jgi:hypothetical protein
MQLFYRRQVRAGVDAIRPLYFSSHTDGLTPIHTSNAGFDALGQRGFIRHGELCIYDNELVSSPIELNTAYCARVTGKLCNSRFGDLFVPGVFQIYKPSENELEIPGWLP